jgi:thioredoxin 1
LNIEIGQSGPPARQLHNVICDKKGTDVETLRLSSEKDFQITIADGVALVDFNAPWCGPCRFQEPIVKDIAEKFKGRALVSEVNVDENREIAIRLGIQSIPTLILFKNGQEIQRFIGLQPATTLSQAIDQALNQPKREVGYGKDVQGI